MELSSCRLRVGLGYDKCLLWKGRIAFVVRVISGGFLA